MQAARADRRWPGCRKQRHPQPKMEEEGAAWIESLADAYTADARPLLGKSSCEPVT